MSMNIIILTDDEVMKKALTYEVKLMGLNAIESPKGTDSYDIVVTDLAQNRLYGIRTDKIIYILQEEHAENIPLSATVLARPFSMSDFRLAIHAMLYNLRPSEPGVIPAEMLTIEITEEGLIVNDKPIELTNTELLIFTELWNSKGKAVSRERLDEITGANRDGNMVTVYINRLREKLLAVSEKRIIRTIRGGGYLISDL